MMNVSKIAFEENMEQKLVSVIIPVYNVQDYLKRCIESILMQSYTNLELILVDDGSSDESANICDFYEKKDSRVRTIHQENHGQAYARNRGLDIAKGEWISFVDSDDWIEPTMIETLFSIANAHNAGVASCAINEVYGTRIKRNEHLNNEVSIFSSDEAVFDLLRQKKIRFEVWNKLWHRNVIGESRFRKGLLCEEVAFDFDLFYKTNKIVHINKPLYNYVVQRPGNTISSFKKTKLYIFEEFKKMLQKYSSVNNIKLKKTMSCLGTKFAVNLYLSAVRFNEEKSTLIFLKKQFNYFFYKNLRCTYKTKKETIQSYLFFFSPSLYCFCFSVKNKKPLKVF